ncbi:MAG TPA: peptide deformylase [Prolixibacteraceae bacterium]|nr:peptide deformylase [Prolixibacteraceae bacterium]HPS14030.1 peptide deformylase [Prolixibacteraceae bacterium]
MRNRYLLGFAVAGLVGLGLLGSCTMDGFNKKEIHRIEAICSGSEVAIYTINNRADSLFLRQEARKLRKNEIGTPSVEKLKRALLQVVTDSLTGGVGIAAPQVGLGVQMIYVKRFDKEGTPFEVYFNPKIEEYSDSVNSGLEGCLSVPGYRGKVDRSQNIEISYLDSTGKKQRESVSGYTAVIFQHETDHLKGTLYFDLVYGGFSSLLPVKEK